MLSLRCRLSMILRRRWWNSCRTSCISSTRSRLIPSRLSRCPRTCPMMFLCEPACVIRSWRNSWWKCRRSCPVPCCSCLWSRTSTFQFLVVEGDLLVFKVFTENRVQLRLFRRRSLTFPFLVVVFKVFALGKVHLLLTLQLVFMKTWMSLVHFSAMVTGAPSSPGVLPVV